MRLLAVALSAVAAVLCTAAVLRPYADNQRNWLVAGSVAAGAGALALLCSRSTVGALGSFWRAVRDEWSGR